MGIRYRSDGFEQEEERDDPPGEDAPVGDRISWLARHHEVEGGTQQLDALLEAHRSEILAYLEGTEPPGPPDPERWPHRMHEIRPTAWKRWLREVDMALALASEGFYEHYLGLTLTLSFRTGPMPGLFAFDGYTEREYPVQTEAARAIAATLLQRLAIPMEALDAALRILAGKHDRALRHLSCIRIEPLPQGPGSSAGAVELQLAAHRDTILQALREVGPVESPDAEHWPHNPQAISAADWRRWLYNLDSFLEDCGLIFEDYGAWLALLLRSDGSYSLLLEDKDKVPQRGPAAQAIAASVLGALGGSTRALQAAIDALDGQLYGACRRLSCVHLEEG